MKAKRFFMSIVLAVCAFFMMFGFSACSSKDMETNNYKITDSFSNISIDVDTANVQFVHTANLDDEIFVSCYEQKKEKHTIEVVEDTLVIKVVDTRKWYEKLFNFVTPRIIIAMPNGDYGALSITADTGDVIVAKSFKFDSINIETSTGDITNYGSSAVGDMKIKASTGNIQLEDASTDSLTCSVSTGKIILTNVKVENDINVKVSTGKSYLTNVTCKNFYSKGDTGNISMVNLLVDEKMNIERSTGDVKFDKCDASEIEVKTDTGNVKGTLRSDKIFITRSDTGKINVPETLTGGKCKITTDTGDIIISIFEE